MTLTWEALAALCAFVGLIVGALIWAMRLLVASALLDFEHRFFERLNGRYIKAELCAARYGEVERRVERLEGAVDAASGGQA